MLNVKMSKNGDRATLFLIGRIDATAAMELRDKLLELSKDYMAMVLDLADLKYISSAGLRAVRSLHLEMRKKDGELILRNVRPDVMDVFRVTGFEHVLNFE